MNGIKPYLTFAGNCEEAFNFYAESLSGKISTIVRFEESGMPLPDEWKQKVYHVTLEFGDTAIMASDSFPGQPPVVGNNISLAIGMDEVKDIEAAFAKLSAGGTITMPLQKTDWSKMFGMCIDKFGIPWMFNCNQEA